LLLGLILADSFQANWKYEAVFLAVGTLIYGGGRLISLDASHAVRHKEVTI
jgi:hypothetical protein